MKKTTNLLWGGRFNEKSSNLLKKINDSIDFDYKLANEDIMLNRSYVESLYKANLLSLKEYKKIKLV